MSSQSRAEVFVDQLRAACEAHADRTAIEYRGRKISYAELDRAARQNAGWLQRQGVARGDRVALFTGDKLPFLLAHLGAIYAGAAPLPLNPRYTREEMRYFLADSLPRVVIAGAEQQALAQELAAELDDRPTVLIDAASLDPPDVDMRETNASADDTAFMLYSSGTTGWPKGVVHTQANVASSLAALGNCWRMSADDVVLNVLPLFHIHGLAFATHLTWLAGGAVLIHDAFEPQAMIDALSATTVCMAVPTIYYRLLEEPGFRASSGWPRVRLFTCGSAPIRSEVLPQLEANLRRPVINRYGMSEAYVITSLPLDGPWPNGSVGRPLDGVELRVMNDRQIAATGEVGSVQIRGANLFREYWRKPESTQAAFVDGWFDTGDLGSLDAAGFLTLAGRKNDLIISGGYNIYPQVVERVIGECPGVRECAVLGLPDAEWGQRVAAAIVRSDATLDEKRLQAWWNERLIHYQRPRALIFVDELPRNSLGKVLRRELSQRFEFSGKSAS